MRQGHEGIDLGPGKAVRIVACDGLTVQAVQVAARVVDPLDATVVIGDGAAMDQHLGDVVVAAGFGKLKGRLTVAMGVGVGPVAEHEERHFPGGGMVGAIDGGQQGRFGAGIDLGALGDEERGHFRLDGVDGVVEGGAAIGGAGAHDFGVGLDQFGGARNVAGGGGLEDIGFGGGDGLRAERAGEARGLHQEAASGVEHGAILRLRRATRQDGAGQFCVIGEVAADVRHAREHQEGAGRGFGPTSRVVMDILNP